jgi:hypothetical protein
MNNDTLDIALMANLSPCLICCLSLSTCRIRFLVRSLLGGVPSSDDAKRLPSKSMANVAAESLSRRYLPKYPPPSSSDNVPCPLGDYTSLTARMKALPSKVHPNQGRPRVTLWFHSFLQSDLLSEKSSFARLQKNSSSNDYPSPCRSCPYPHEQEFDEFFIIPPRCGFLRT